jgi:hypothetical protein
MLRILCNGPHYVEWNCLPAESDPEPLTANACDLLHIPDVHFVLTFTQFQLDV